MKHAVILAGGSGTRFWPLSRRNLPKQLLPIWEGRTLIELTLERLRRMVSDERLYVVTGPHLKEAIRPFLVGDSTEHLIVEPSARNTMPCIALATLVLEARDPDAIIGVFPADHFIDDDEAFDTACALAYEEARVGKIATLGVRPTRAETGYGYIKFHPSESPARSVERFVEKPNLVDAERYLADGGYLWNAGIFFFTPAKLRAEMERQRPDQLSAYSALGEAIAAGDPVATEVAFHELEPISIDYAVMEGAEDVVVIPASYGWNDVGHFASLSDVLGADDDANVVLGDVLAVDAHDSVLINLGSQERVLSVVGVEGLVVVATDDAVLVLPKENSQRVRDIVSRLKEEGRDQSL